MNVNFGLFPPLSDLRLRGRERKAAVAARALADIDHWLSRPAAAA
jgi:methylenetetrahydrofolate--tRNA-(uracil-5-)-methyltransferase